MNEACGGGRTGWLSGAVRRTTVDVDSGTWIPALAPLIAAEQVSPPVGLRFLHA